MPYKDPADRAAYRRRRRAEINALLDQYKSQPCADCGNSYPPRVMDFDHGTAAKAFTIGDFERLGLGVDALQTEIAKCDIVCANCHRLRTWY